MPPTSEKNIARHLQEAGFTQLHKDMDCPTTEAYAKEIEGAEVEIEFLTDQETRGDKNKNVVISSVVAQPLNYLKLCKDLYGIWYVCSQMGSFSQETMAEFQNLAVQYPKFFKRVERNLGEWMEKATPVHWSRLVDQDPFGVLTRHKFEKVVERLTDQKYVEPS